MTTTHRPRTPKTRQDLQRSHASRVRRVLLVIGAASVIALAACGSDNGTEDAGAGSVASDTTSTTTVSEQDQATVDKVNANTASVAGLTAAFEAAGVPNASKWAREVEEYRPYTDDGWAHLREELDKYNIDDETFEKITNVLEL